MTKTIVKTLTGELLDIEYCGEEDLKLQINKKIPYLYHECQNIIYEKDETNCYVIVDLVKDVIEVNIEYSPIPFYISTKIKIIEDFKPEILLNYVNDLEKYNPYLFNYYGSYEESPQHNIIKAKSIDIKWYNKNNKNREYKETVVYHPDYGFTTEEFMQTEHIQKHIQNNKFVLHVPHVRYPKYWFKTPGEMINFIKNKGMRLDIPYIFNSDDFLYKLKNLL